MLFSLYLDMISISLMVKGINRELTVFSHTNVMSIICYFLHFSAN